ncbi:type VII secretion-associated serine protease mycosin [Nocardia sp. NBC_01327]|uniref:type VII secretion-associated serine protease mycosin n=1 Tax=Nocardia sp. NBC_01327 TaxID=2903593 RepID=UPI002E157485|nr:type VII secretion-associated serine protease mycosin [Nocardia sp. NBC_01327]
MRRNGIGALLAAGLALAGVAAPAGAVQPPEIVTGTQPADDPPRPELPTKQDKGCLAAGALPNSDLTQAPPPERALDLRHTRALSEGTGVTVAIIDTGVSPNPRLPNLIGGGDYVETGGDGLSDCDAHGTLIAGIVGAAPDPADGFRGVAPAARIISLRYRSGAFSPKDAVNYDPAQQITVEIHTLARAITRAANLGAQVITVALPICVPAELGVDQSALSSAIGYAVHTKGALVVAGAGDTGGENCEQNPDIDPARPTDPRNWDSVKTISTPGWFQPDVLTVGCTASTGEPMPDSLTGPWISVAAPGTGIESLGPGGGGLINGVGPPDKLGAVGGASFATGYVSGVAALLRSRFPNETPAEITARLQASAHAPARGIDNTLGAGLIDPSAALSYRTPPQSPAGLYRGTRLVMPAPSRPKDLRPGFTLAGVVAFAVLLGFGMGLAHTIFRRQG